MSGLAPGDGRRLDARAVGRILGRLGARGEPPWLHAEVARRMAEKLALIRLAPDVAVDWWSTPGAAASLLTEAYPKALHLRVEPDAGWVERSRSASTGRWWQPARWTGPTVSVIAAEMPIEPESAGLVWANMMLHAVVDPVPLIERWHRLLKLDGFVMFSCLGPGTLQALRVLYAQRGWPTPTPGFIDMHDLGDMLVQAGFADPVMDQETITLKWSGAEALLRELRSLGGNAAPDRHAALRTPRWRRELTRALESTAAPDGSISLGFEIAYGHAFKAAPRPVGGAPATVSLDEMRRLIRAPGSRPPLR